MLLNSNPTDHGQAKPIQDLVVEAECDVQSIY